MLSSGRATLVVFLLIAAVAAGCGGSDSSGSEEGAAGELRVTWEKPASKSDQLGYETLKASETELLAETLAKTFQLRDPLTVEGVNGTGQGPSYDSEDNSITLPYGFAAVVSEAVVASNSLAKKREQRERVAAVNDLIFEHQLGHALTTAYELPVSGKEEDTADEIATILLLKEKTGAQYGADAAIFLANFSNAQKPPVLGDYVNAHALDLEHALKILCWVAGSSKQALKEVAGIGAIGVGNCPQEFEQVSDGVTQELSTHLEDGASLAPATPAAEAGA